MKRYDTLDSSIGSRSVLDCFSIALRSVLVRSSIDSRSSFVHPSFILRSGFVRESFGNRRTIEDVSKVYRRQNGGQTKMHRMTKGKPTVWQPVLLLAQAMARTPYSPMVCVRDNLEFWVLYFELFAALHAILNYSILNLTLNINQSNSWIILGNSWLKHLYSLLTMSSSSRSISTVAPEMYLISQPMTAVVPCSSGRNFLTSFVVLHRMKHVRFRCWNQYLLAGNAYRMSKVTNF